MPMWWPQEAHDYLLRGAHTEYWDVRSCDDPIENQDCPCDKCHLLHYRKEPLVHYRGKVWALRCCIEDMAYQFQVTRERNEDLAKENSQLKGLCQENSNRIGRLVKHFREYTCHKEDCEVVQDAFSGRLIASRCTCGYNGAAKMAERDGVSSKGKT